jgi:hypothetical protein
LLLLPPFLLVSAAHVPYLITVGNHDSDWPGTSTIPGYGSASGGECGVVTTALLPMPSPATLDQPWWSYDIGLIHFVGMSTEHDFTIDSPQFQWMESDLSSVNRSVTPWVVFSGHRSMYVDSAWCCSLGSTEACSAAGLTCEVGSDVQVMVDLQANIEDLLFKYRVNLAFAGHFHNVERQSAVYQGKVVQRASKGYDADGNVVWQHANPQATVWMVVGTAGNGPYEATANYTWTERSWYNVFGYALVSAVNATHLDWKFINSANNHVVDRMVITQDFAPWSTGDAGSHSSGWASLSAGAQGGIIFAIIFVSLALFGGAVYYGNRRQDRSLVNSQSPPLTPVDSAKSPLQNSPVFNVELNNIA